MKTDRLGNANYLSITSFQLKS